ncbi:DUF3130 family protein [uncultured Enterococcus sp.]|uniref:DUF3130 family protein n=1 Tax=uncultured Enterococcus sp. TaxID=167972 RepID=UPI002AA6EC61|nr:DUF3130 family protein [uncultured Enterococcus sp.]
MIKNSVRVANTIANEIAKGGNMTFNVQASVSYSDSPAVSGLTSCISDLTGLVSGFASNVQTDSVNIRQVAAAYKNADSEAGKVVSND